MYLRTVLPTWTLLVLASSAVNIPANLQTFYNSVVAQGQCNNKLASGLYSWNGGPPGEKIFLMSQEAINPTNMFETGPIAVTISPARASYISKAPVVF